MALRSAPRLGASDLYLALAVWKEWFGTLSPTPKLILLKGPPANPGSTLGN